MRATERASRCSVRSPEIYFLFRPASPATGYIYTYGLMEPQPYALKMQQEMIAEIEAAQPEYIVFVGVPQSFGQVAGTSEGYIFRWIDSYTCARSTTLWE